VGARARTRFRLASAKKRKSSFADIKEREERKLA